jgi:hypothetical protein
MAQQTSRVKTKQFHRTLKFDVCHTHNKSLSYELYPYEKYIVLYGNWISLSDVFYLKFKDLISLI